RRVLFRSVTALKAHEVERYVQKPDLKTGFFLAYGTDAGLVHETALALIAHYAGTPPDPMAHVTLDAQDIDADPGRLAIEARTASLFGGTRTIRVRGATKALAPTLSALVDDMPDAILVLEAANLAKNDALRVLAERSALARALPRYADNDQSLNQLIASTFSAANISI